MTVCILDTRDNSYKIVYDCIPTLEETELLAQLEMGKKQEYELVFAFVGYNRDIKKNEKEYNRALQLSKEYKEDNSRICKGDKNDLDIFKANIKRYIDSL